MGKEKGKSEKGCCLLCLLLLLLLIFPHYLIKKKINLALMVAYSC